MRPRFYCSKCNSTVTIRDGPTKNPDRIKKKFVTSHKKICDGEIKYRAGIG